MESKGFQTLSLAPYVHSREHVSSSELGLMVQSTKQLPTCMSLTYYFFCLECLFPGWFSLCSGVSSSVNLPIFFQSHPSLRHIHYFCLYALIKSFTNVNYNSVLTYVFPCLSAFLSTSTGGQSYLIHLDILIHQLSAWFLVSV